MANWSNESKAKEAGSCHSPPIDLQFLFFILKMMVPLLGRGVSDGLGSDVAEPPDQAGADDLGLHGMIAQAILVPFPQPRHFSLGSKLALPKRQDQDHGDGSRGVIAYRLGSHFADGITARKDILHLL